MYVTGRLFERPVSLYAWEPRFELAEPVSPDRRRDGRRVGALTSAAARDQVVAHGGGVELRALEQLGAEHHVVELDVGRRGEGVPAQPEVQAVVGDPEHEGRGRCPRCVVQAVEQLTGAAAALASRGVMKADRSS